jgi:23S rRNA pseudouridine955/2504/2580 synthase|tara:strand:- start:2882 stop:3796 length:915 start_codon:yes stop_codon:yes gene_type:complete
MAKKFEVEKDFHNARFDRWFKHKVLDIPQGLIEKIIRKNQVKVNGKKTKSSYRVQKTDIVEVFNIDKIKKTPKNVVTQYIPSNTERDKYDNFVIEDNENFIVINKPSGIAVQSGTKSFKNVVDTLRETKYFDNTKPFIVHRLDKETSGILIVAKNREYAQLFTSLFRIRKIHKTYLAIVYGEITKETKLLEDDLVMYEKDKKVVQKATSYLKVLKSNTQYSLVELRPITGRKHQLRKQLYNIGNSIIGDDKYYVKRSGDFVKGKNLMLHAYEIKFMINNVKYNFKADFNNEFRDFINKKDLNIF